MKKILLFVSGLALGVAVVAAVRFAGFGAAAPISPATAPLEVAALRQTIADQSNRISRLKSENAALVEGLSKIVTTATKPGLAPSAPPVQQPAAPPASAADAGRPAGFGKMIKVAMQQQVEMKLAAMKSRLHLTDEQAQVVRELLEKQLGAAGDMVSKMFEGKSSKDDLAGKAAASFDVDGQLKKILTPDQWGDYQDYQIEERHTQAQMAANVELMQLQPMLQLNPQQRDQVFNIISQQTAQQLDKTAGGTKLPTDWEQNLEAKREAVRAVLTPEQQQSYDKFVETQREMIKSLMGPGKKGGVSGSVTVSP